MNGIIIPDYTCTYFRQETLDDNSGAEPGADHLAVDPDAFAVVVVGPGAPAAEAGAGRRARLHHRHLATHLSQARTKRVHHIKDINCIQFLYRYEYDLHFARVYFMI